LTLAGVICALDFCESKCANITQRERGFIALGNKVLKWLNFRQIWLQIDLLNSVFFAQKYGDSTRIAVLGNLIAERDNSAFSTF